MKIVIVTPARRFSRSGNRHTAQRWAGLLRSLGHSVLVEPEWSGIAADAMIALHARRSHRSLIEYRERYPSQPLALVLTGTDLYRDIRGDRGAKRSMEVADVLVVLQDQGLNELQPRLRSKARVIYQSAPTRLRHRPPARSFRACVLGHLREEKDPFRAALALGHIGDLDRIEVLHLGAALSSDMAIEARAWTRRDARYRWLGELPHWRAQRWLAHSHVLVVSSRMEGGANVIAEAARIRVPVLASHISGNVGMLGHGYPGYFAPGDERALGTLLRRASTDSAYYRRLVQAIVERRQLFSPQAERAALMRLAADLAGVGQAR